MIDNKEESKEQMEPMEKKIQSEVNIEVKQMLKVESKYCTRIRHTTSMRSPVPITSLIIREDIPVPDARVFLLHNLLTPSECAHYIRETEEICYRDLKSEFEESYRSNERLLVLSETLADCLWRRMQPHLHRNDVIRVRPMCFGNGGSWLPQRLNECFKFGKYQKKQHFGSHIDGPWVPRSDESSIYTVLIYLNDDFEGGETVFTPPSERAKLDQAIADTRQSIEAGMKNLAISSEKAPSTSASQSGYRIDPSTGKVTIQPRQGTALIFTHDTLHAGLPVLAGKKYVLRTEIMFTRRDSDSIPASIRESYQSDPNYQQTVTFYMDSYAKSLKGDVTGFTNSYLAALKLQHEAQFSVSKDTKAIHELNLPLSLYVHLFTFLDLKDLVSALQCSKSFKDIGKDGSLWKQLYRIRFPLQAQMESHLQQQQRLSKPSSIASSTIPTLPPDEPPIPLSNNYTAEVKRRKKQATHARIEARADFGPIDPAIQDWYTIFKQRILLQHKFEPVIFDFGSFSTKCSLMTSSDTPVLELLNLVAVIDGLHDIHCRRGAHERYLTGLAVRQDTRSGSYYRHGKHVIVKGQPQETSLLPELIAPNLLQLSVWSYQHPMIIAEPPFRWEKSTRIKLMKHLFAIFRLPALCFVNSAVLSLMSQGLDSGLVAHVGHDTVWVAGIYCRRMISFFDFTPNLESPNAIFNSTYSMRINQDDDEMVKDGTVTPQTQVTPEELAVRTADTYLEMLAQVTDDHRHVNFHQIVLCGGGTIDQWFREKYQRGITAANGARRHADIVKIRETMLKNANIATDLGAVPPTVDYIHDMVVILPADPTHTEVEGGKVFGGLSFFQQHCIRQFGMKHLDEDKDEYNDLDPVVLYADLWHQSEWLHTQFLYFTIKDHFHLDEETNSYIANTSCSDDEVERVIQAEGVKDTERLIHSNQVGRSLIWRRRRLLAKPRGPKPPQQKTHTAQRQPKRSDDTDQDDEGEEAEKAEVAEVKAELERRMAALMSQVNDPSTTKPDPKYPMRRPRRSAFPILPQPAVKWFQYQTKLRSLTGRTTTVTQSDYASAAVDTAEQKVSHADSNHENSEKDGHHVHPSTHLFSPHLQTDISTLDADTREDQEQIKYWDVRSILANIREFKQIKGHRLSRQLLVDRVLLTADGFPMVEEVEDLNEPEEFVEEPNRLVQNKLDYFDGLKAARSFAASFVSRHQHSYPTPSNSEKHFEFFGYLRLCSKIPDGAGGQMPIAHSVHSLNGDFGFTLRFVTYEWNGKMVTAMVGSPSELVHFGLLLDCRLPVESDPSPNLHYPCDTKFKSGWFYLFTRPLTAASTTSTNGTAVSSSTSHQLEADHTFICKLTWQSKSVTPRDVVQAARDRIEATKRINQKKHL